MSTDGICWREVTTRPEERGVTPVIGIILMVAITVILAAVVGTFALGLFDRDTNPAPSVSFEYDYDESASELTIIHTSGNEFQSNNIEFKLKGGGSPSVTETWPTEVTSGDHTTLGGMDTDDELLIVWQDPRARDTSTILGTWTGPDA